MGTLLGEDENEAEGESDARAKAVLGLNKLKVSIEGMVAVQAVMRHSYTCTRAEVESAMQTALGLRTREADDPP